MRRVVVLTLTCLMGQACTPLVYELATASETMHLPHTSDEPGSSTGDTTDADDTTVPDPTETGTSEPTSCKDGGQSGDETDVDCGGACPPCQPGQQCEGPKDCIFGLCKDGQCDKPLCGGPQDCPPPGAACLLAVCEAGQCALVPVGDGEPCDEGDPCTLGDTCIAGKCEIKETLDCSKFDGPCRAGVCNPGTGSCAVEWLFEGEPCKDGQNCDFGALCSSGECVAPPPPPPLLFTDFSLAGGWTAEPPWQIGPAVASKCSDKFADDPEFDTSPSADNHVAGAAIGDCLPTDPFLKACLTSPVIDAFVPGELWVSYMALLNTAGAPMISSVEVFDSKAQTWLPIVTVDEFFAEGKWGPHAHELTAFKGPELRVRFCHGADGPSPVTVGGWSIDDLSIGPPLCAP